MPTEHDEDSTPKHWRGSDESLPHQAAVGYGGYAPRPPGLFTITRGIVDTASLPAPLRLVFEELDTAAAEPFIGLTSDGSVVPDLYLLRDTGVSTRPLVDAARHFLDLLSPAERVAAVQPVDSQAWRTWINAFAPRPPQGLLLEDAPVRTRAAALGVFEAVLSPQGYDDLRTAMRINAALGEIAPGYEDTLREYMYWVTVFGEPSEDRPWGIQIFGHHVAMNVFVVGRQVTLGPVFLGAEPRVVETGTYAGTEAFGDVQSLARDLMRSLTPAQQRAAVLSESIRWEDLPAELAHPTEGRMRGSVGRDNAIVPLDGINARELTSAQRRLLRALIARYVTRQAEPHATTLLEAVDAHLDDTSFSWVGSIDDDAPFYYKIQSPVIFIELDCHAGIFLSNDDPEPFHVHTIVRFPNGNDYGRALLSRFQEQHAS